MKSKKVIPIICLSSLLSMASIISPLPHANASTHVNTKEESNKNFKKTPTIIKDIESSLPNTITNFNMITNTDELLEYSYTENNKKYKVVEEFNADQTSVNSIIYEVDKVTGSTTVIDKLVTTLNKKDNSIESYSLISNEKNLINLNEVLSESEIDLNDSDLTALAKYDWVYQNTYYGDNTFNRITVAAIAITIAGITKLPATAKVVINISNAVFQIGTGKIYYIKHTYKDKNSNKLRPRIKIITHFYSDAKRKKLIKGNVTNIYSR